MQDAEEADFGTEVFGVTRDLQQCFRAGLEKQIANDLFVLERERAKFMWEREDNMNVACRQ